MPTDASRAAQAAHLARLKAMERYPGCTITGPDNLAKHILSSAILDLLVKADVVAYAEKLGRERDVANGFIKEMAQKVASDRNLDLEGMQRAVRNAIDIYAKEIAGGRTPTNYDAIVDEALSRARSLVDVGKSGLARAALRKASEDLRHQEEARQEARRHEEEEQRGRYVAGLTAIHNRERDIALAAYDGEAAAEAIVALAGALHDANPALIVEFLNSEAETLLEYGRDRGSNVHLVATTALRRKTLVLAVSSSERGAAYHNLGNVLWTLGERESGTARLEEAVAAYRAALEQSTRERAPLDWATTQNNLGTALWTLGERESGAARLEEAVAAFNTCLAITTPVWPPE